MSVDIQIDGSAGEGGGQILRTAMTLSCITGKSIRIYNIRAGRPKPGLQNQHMTSVLAACEVSQGRISGCILNSTEIVFYPGQIKSGDYSFVIPSAGSTIMLLQTVIPILWFGQGISTVRVKGGTHNGMSPSFDFYKHVFCPLMPVHTECQIIRYGFYPGGNGEVIVMTNPTIKRATSLILLTKGQLLVREMNMTFTKTMDICNKINEHLTPDFKCNLTEVQASGKGLPAVSMYVKYTGITEIITIYHQRQNTPKKTADEFMGSCTEYLTAEAPVDEHLADQLLLPLALLSGGTFKATSISKYSKHFETNAQIIHMFLGPRIYTTATPSGVEVHVV